MDSIGRQLGEWARRHQHTILLVLIAAAALWLRKSLIYFVGNLDYSNHFKPWYDYILDHGGFAALSDDFSNYTPAYLIMLATGAVLIGDSGYRPYAIKGIPIAFDLIGAYFIYRIVKLKYPQGLWPVYAAATFLFMPSILIVSGYWGQNDMVYIAGLLGCLYFLLADREVPAFLALGWAFAIKLQAVFLFPFIALLWLRRHVSRFTWLLVPAVYLAAALPVYFIGRPWNELLLIYFGQSNQYPELSLNAPSIYAWLQVWLPESFGAVGSVLALILIGLAVLWVARRPKRLTNDQLVMLAFLSVLLTPFLLPRMHERYFLAADAFAIVLAFYNRRYAYVPVVLAFVSIFAYLPFLLRAPLIPIPMLAFFLLGILVHILWDWRIWMETPPPFPVEQPGRAGG